VNDTWWRVTVTGNPDATDAIGATIVAATGNGVEEPHAGTVCTTLASEDAAQSLQRRLNGQFDSLEIAIEPRPAVDWSTRWRDGIVTRTFGRLVVTPSWLPVAREPGNVVLTLDPESAFGSGEHGSTRGALALLAHHVQPGDHMLDLGSGSGILAIAAVLLGARSAIGIEVDEESVPVAAANAAKNGVDDRIVFLTGDAADLAPLAGPAEFICSNILRSVNILLLPAIRRAVTPRGLVIFAGMEDDEAVLFRPVLEAGQFEIVEEVRDGGWWSVAVRAP
jgi:ribosomal protein L11 methyltransferase